MTQSLAEALGALMAEKIAGVRGEMDGLMRIREVPTLADRDAIPLSHRTDGMWVKVADPDSIWSLTGGISNEYWVDKFPLDSIPGGAPTSVLLSHLSPQVSAFFVAKADFDAAIATLNAARRQDRRRKLLDL